jgi:hypothetical protein
VVRRAQLLLVALVASAFTLLRARDARADDASRFEVSSKDEARTCGDTEILRAKVAERLGRDPFTAEASSGRLRISFARERQAWTAEITMFDAAGERSGVRTLTRAGATCEPLVTSVVFTVAVLLEELAPRAPSPPQAPPRDAPRSPEEPWPQPPAPDTPRPPPPPRTTHVDAALGATGAVGGAPAPSVGGEIVVGLDVTRFRVELAGRLYLPASSDGDVAVRTRLVYGRIAPCYGWEVLSACFVAAVGSVSGEATGARVASSQLDGQVYAAGGVGALSRLFFIGDRLFVRASIDLLFAATRVGFDVGDRRVWTLPVVSAASVVGFGARLP